MSATVVPFAPCPRCGEYRAAVRCAEGCGCAIVVCGCAARPRSAYLRRDGACRGCAAQRLAQRAREARRGRA